MPATYLIEAMNYVVLDVGEVADLWTAVAALVASTVASILVSWAVVRRAG